MWVLRIAYANDLPGMRLWTELQCGEWSHRDAVGLSYLRNVPCRASGLPLSAMPQRETFVKQNQYRLSGLCVHNGASMHRITHFWVTYLLLFVDSIILRTCLPVHTRNAYLSKLWLKGEARILLMLLNFLIPMHFLFRILWPSSTTVPLRSYRISKL